MRHLFAGMFVLVATSAFAQASEQFASCNKTATTQLQMNLCASDEVKRAERELDGRYKKLVADAAGDERALEGIKSMQTAWILYRDAYIEAMYPAENKQSEYGTRYPQSANIVRARLTRQQLAAIDAILEEHKPR